MKQRNNPYLTATAGATDLSSMRKADGSQLVGANGEINASSKKDLLKQIAAFLAVASGEDTQQQIVTPAMASERARENREWVTAAFADSNQHKALGEVMANDLYVSANRQGFARRFLGYKQLTQGQEARVALRMKNVMAYEATSMSRVQAQYVRDNIYRPQEFYIQARPFIGEKDIQQSTEDLLEEKFVEASEGVMVREDRLWYKMAKASSTIVNNQTLLTGQMTPASLAALRNQVTRWNIPVAHLLMANDLWNDILGNDQFSNIIDPVSKAELLLTGKLGTILDMEVTSDGYRHPNHKVLQKGELFVVGNAENHGQITDRGGIVSVPLDASHEGTPGRGWHFYELVTMVIANPRSVAYGKRV